MSPSLRCARRQPRPNPTRLVPLIFLVVLFVLPGGAFAAAAGELTVGARRSVTADGGYHPRWSPDGQSIAYTSGVWPDVGISVVPAAGGAPAALPLDRGGDLYLSWHPAGDLIAFDGYDATGRLSLYTVSIAGGTVTRLTTLTGASGPDWRRDGARLAFTRSGALWTVAADGSDPAPLAFTAAADPYYPRWSPDGTRLAFAAVTGGNHDIWILDVATGASIRFTDYAGMDNRPAWSPDGLWLAWTSDRSGALQVYARPVAGGETILLSAGHGDAAMPDWRSDGKALCYVADGGVWTVAVDGIVPEVRSSLGAVKSAYR